jgi:hypothetical protein
MSANSHGDHYDDGYGQRHPNTDSYYQDDRQPYYDQADYQQQATGADGYYDES